MDGSRRTRVGKQPYTSNMNILLKASLCALALAPLPALADGSYVGVHAGYFVDGQDLALATQIGGVFARSGTIAHCGELEILWTQASEGPIDLDIVPVMLNYRMRSEVSPKLSLEIGAGLGMSFNQLSAYGDSDDDTSFAIQAMGGLLYRLSDSMGLYTGVRYLRIDEATLMGITADVGDDVSVEVGVRFGF